MTLEQTALDLGIGIGMGTLIAVMAFLSTDAKWNNKLFAYTLILASFTAFAVIDTIEGGVSEANLISVILAIAGASFFANKGIKIANRLRGIKTITT